MSKETPEYVRRIGFAIYSRRSRAAGPTGRGILSVRSAAKEIGVSAATLSRIERGYPPDVDSFRKICLWLETSADELLALKAAA